MIELFRYANKWRLKIVNETLEFKDTKDLQKTRDTLIKMKEDKEPHKS